MQIYDGIHQFNEINTPLIKDTGIGPLFLGNTFTPWFAGVGDLAVNGDLEVLGKTYLRDPLYIYSVTDPASDPDEWVSISHKVTYGLVECKTGPLHLGKTGIPSWAVLDGDVYMDGTLEVKDNIYVRGKIQTTGVINLTGGPSSALVCYNSPIFLGYPSWSGSVLRADPWTRQTVWTLGPDLDHQIIIGKYHSFNPDWGHADPLDPSIYIHSRTDPATDDQEFIGLSHKVTRGLIECATGPLVLGKDGTPVYAAQDGACFIPGRLEVDDTLFINGGFTMTNPSTSCWLNYINLFGYIRIGADAGLMGGNNQLLIMGRDEYNIVVLTNWDRLNVNFNHSPETHPTFFFHDNTASQNNWLSAGHKGTYGLIKCNVGDLKFEDPNAGVITLSELKSMRNIWLNATSQAPGNLTLSDATNWNAQYSHISGLKIKTSSTDFELWLCEDNTFTKTALKTRYLGKFTSTGAQVRDVSIDREYNSDGTNLYLIYQDNDTGGPYNADVYITGEARRH